MALIDFTLEQSMHLKRESRGFTLVRESVKCYLFCHFINPVDIIDGGRLIRTSSNACYLCTPGSPVWYKSEIIDILHNFLHFQIRDTEAFSALGIPLNRVFYTDMQENITRSVEYIEWLQNSGSDRVKEKENICLNELFSQLAEERRKNRIPIGQSSQVAFDNLRSMIYISPADWSVASMANFVHLSRSHFSVKYKERFGISPNEDLTQAALLLAVRLLTTGSMQVSDIAYECGFRSPEYFIRLFKSKNGVTPGRYREEYDNGTVTAPGTKKKADATGKAGG